MGAPTNVQLEITISKDVANPHLRLTRTGELIVGKCYASMSHGNDATAPKHALVALTLFSG